jgi:hypothetical protein
VSSGNPQSSPAWFSVLLREHPALLVSGMYVAASTIGMVYSWDFLRHFGINVFNFAQIGDFLLASLKEPFTWGIVFAAIALMFLDNAMSRGAQKKALPRWVRWYGSNVYRSINYLTAMLLILIFLHIYAGTQAEIVKSGKGEVVEIALADGSPPRKAVLLGTTAQFLFLYDATTRRVDIHPNENVQAISLTAQEAD